MRSSGQNGCAEIPTTARSQGSAGSRNACGIGLVTSYLACWGSLDAGGLGLGINAGFTNVPTLVG